MLRALIVGLTFSLGHVASASAFLFCSKPTEPTCIDRYGTFDNEWSFDRCKDEIKTYVSELKSYRSCVIRTTQSEADAIVEKFNCKAKGGIVCR